MQSDVGEIVRPKTALLCLDESVEALCSILLGLPQRCTAFPLLGEAAICRMHKSTPDVLSAGINWLLRFAGDCCLAVPRGVSVGVSRGSGYSLECRSETSVIRYGTLTYQP